MEIKNVKMINKGSIVCKFDIYFPAFGMTIKEFILMHSQDKKWISSPSRQYQEQDGKKKYFQYIFFEERTRDAFQKKCMELLTPMLSNQTQETTYIQEECPF